MNISYTLLFKVIFEKGYVVSKKKNKNLLVRLVSTAGTGYFLVKKRNPKTLTEKLSFRKYDPKIRKHVEFKEEKIK
jgi:large subunit ribosomal protein L33